MNNSISGNYVDIVIQPALPRGKVVMDKENNKLYCHPDDLDTVTDGLNRMNNQEKEKLKPGHDDNNFSFSEWLEKSP